MEKNHCSCFSTISFICRWRNGWWILLRCTFENLLDSPKTGKIYFRIEGVHNISSVDVKSGKDRANLEKASLDWVLMVER